MKNLYAETADLEKQVREMRGWPDKVQRRILLYKWGWPVADMTDEQIEVEFKAITEEE